MNLKLLSALNVGCDDELIDFLMNGLQDGHFRAVTDGDLIIAMKLTGLGIESLPPTLPTASA
jgi:hypothetical protein